METPKIRDSNIELFRIIMMLSIVTHHYVVSSGITDIIAIPPYSWQAYFLYIFGLWGKIGINCFVLITGYYMCLCHNTDWIFSPYIPLHAFGCVIAIFMACVIIDRIRIHLLENPTFIVIDKWLTKHNKQ